jgi:hypothetical protein
MGVLSLARGFDWSRSIKYAALILLAGLHLLYIIILFSSYTVRRELEADIGKLGADSSLDSLLLLANTGAETVRRVNEYRCLQRDAITFYRIHTMDLRKDIAGIYRLTLALRGEMRDFVNDHPGALNRADTLRRFDDVWSLPTPGDLIFLPSADANAIAATVAEFEALLKASVRRFNQDAASYAAAVALLHAHVDEIKDPEDLLKKMVKRQQLWDAHLFDFTAVGTLQKALDELNHKMKSAGLEDPRRLNILIKKLAADDAIVRRESNASFLSELARQLDASGQGGQALKDLDCGSLDQDLRSRIIQGIARRGDKDVSPDQKALIEAYLAERAEARPAKGLGRAVAYLRDDLHGPVIRSFIASPTSAQTLIVAMLFGSLGALCLQTLRLSNRGYWATVSAPGWGEIFMSMVLGMAAAMIVYLLGSMGLLLVSDGRSSAQQFTTVGAAFVALLGFISGFLNDDAFGRIRRFGLQLFRDETKEGAEAALTGPDAELVQRLVDAKCTRFAELANLHRLGSTLAQKDQFTLFVPGDALFEARPLAEWAKLADPKQPRPFTDLVNRRLVETAKLGAGDLAHQASLKMADGSTATVVAAADGTIQVDGMLVRPGAEYAWRNGTLLVVAEAQSQTLAQPTALASS